MIVLDTSALIAIVAKEPERESFLAVVEAGGECFVSALTLYETRLVALSRLGDAGLKEVNDLIDAIAVTVVSFDNAQSELAFQAYRQFGKGFHAGAALNICDCAAYALAIALSAPLLFKGNDFAATDVIAAP